jgi:predicted small lipoprotein YifL
MVRASRHILFLTCTAVLLSGCGLKGPLYLPEERAKQQADQKASEEAEQQKKNRATNPPSSPNLPAVPTDTTNPPSSTTPPPGH